MDTTIRHAAFGLSAEALDVVVIDDSRPMLTLIRSMLTAFRVGRVRTYEHAEPAMASMLAEPPNLILADWHMEPISGYKLLSSIRRRALAPLCTVPVIMISAHGTRNFVESSLRAGAHAFLVKPLAPSVLHRAIMRLVSDARTFEVKNDVYMIEGVAEALDAKRQRLSDIERIRKENEETKQKLAKLAAEKKAAQPAEPVLVLRPTGEVGRDYGELNVVRNR